MTGMINDHAPIVDTKIGDLPAGIGAFSGGEHEIPRYDPVWLRLSCPIEKQMALLIEVTHNAPLLPFDIAHRRLTAKS